MNNKLESLPIFQEIPRQIVARILKHAKTKQYSTGDFLVREGEPGQEFFLILSGTVEVTKKNGVPPVTLGPGDGFGEIALIERIKRTASARALEPLQVVVLEKKLFDLLFLPGSQERKTLTQNIRQKGASLPFS